MVHSRSLRSDGEDLERWEAEEAVGAMAHLLVLGNSLPHYPIRLFRTLDIPARLM